MKKASFYTYSFGCRVNQAEKEVIDRQLLDFSFRIDENKPDFYIINTCCVTQKAEREAKNLIYRIKRRFPKAKIVITGCAATYWQKNNLLKNLPVDLLINNIDKEFLVKILLKSLPNQPRPYLKDTKDDVATLDKYLNSGRALVKIQDGCQRFCSYCIVPYLRGTPKSYKIEEIISQINKHKNLKEVIFTAINTEAFGKDSGETLIQLIKTVITNSTAPRISFGSIHPWSIDNEFLEFYKQILPSNRLVNFFHIPIQSGSNKILSLMKRGYRREEIREKLREIERINPFALIATDIIVGFLDETEADFQETVNFLEKSLISKFHIFRFSKRKNTAAYYMSKNLKEPSDQEKMKRAKILIDLGKKKYQVFLKKNVGRISQALFINIKEDSYQKALIDNQLPILVKTSKDLNGRLKNIKIVEYKKGRLFGKIV
jgi:threonylcarbamoyladenosine tRNA methylthiotransferase MtaB